MTPEEFRQHGRDVIDWIADYMEQVEQYPVHSRVEPGEVREGLPEQPPEEGEPFDPKRMAEILKQLEEEERTRLAGFLTADQVDQYKSRSSRSVQVMSLDVGSADGAGVLSEALNFSIQLPPGVIGASAIRTLTVQGDAAGDDAGAAVIFGESEFFIDGEEPGEIIFHNGELPLPPLPPLPPFPEE